MINSKKYYKNLNIRIDVHTLEQLNSLCEWLGYGKSWLVRELINRFYVECFEKKGDI